MRGRQPSGETEPHRPSGRPALQAKSFYFSTPTASIQQSEVFHFHQRDCRERPRSWIYSRLSNDQLLLFSRARIKAFSTSSSGLPCLQTAASRQALEASPGSGDMVQGPGDSTQTVLCFSSPYVEPWLTNTWPFYIGRKACM